MDGLLGVAGMIMTSDYGSFPHSLRLAPVRITPSPEFYWALLWGIFPHDVRKSIARKNASLWTKGYSPGLPT